MLEGARRGPGAGRAAARPPRQGPSRRPRGGRRAAGPPRGDRRLGRGQHAPATRDVPRPRRHRDGHRSAALTAHFVGLPWVLEVVAHGDTKATVITKQGLRLDLRVVPPESYGDLLQHFTGSKDHNVALREQAQRDGLSVSEYGVTVVETGEVHTFKDEESLYAFLGYSYIPPELRENSGELEAARAGNAPTARRARRPPRRDALPLDVVLGRQGDDRGDGPHRGRPRLRVSLPHRSLALPPRGQAGAAVAGDRRGQRAACSLPRAAGRRGEHHGARSRGRPGRDAGGARLGRGLAPHLASTATRPSASSPRSRTRTSTASGT